MKFSKLGVISAAVTMAMASVASAAAFTPGNLAIYRVGTGTGALANTGNAAFVDEYTTSGTLVQSIPLGVIASGTATSEGMLTLSADGRFLVATGYASTGATSIASSASASNNRVVARIDAAGNVDTTTRLTDFSTGNNPRGVASTNGTDFWVVGGAGGIRYTTLGSTTSTQISTSVTNLRTAAIYDGQLYTSTSSGTAVRVGTVGTGLPTTIGQTITNLAGIPTSGSPYQFVLLDTSATVPGVDTLYVADDSPGTIVKYSLVGSSWVSNGSIAATAIRGLTGVVTGSGVQLFGTTGASSSTGGGTLYGLLDPAGYNATIGGTVSNLATLSNTSNQAFRGIAFAVPEPAALGLLAPVGAMLLGRRRR